MAIYKITSHAGSGKCLNIYGGGQIADHDNVCIWSDSGANEQKWSIATLAGNTQILSCANMAYGLNIWRGSDNKNNCDVHPVNGNAGDSTVSMTAINAVGKLYTIQLKHHSLFLTAKGIGDGADVRWEAASGTVNQQWKLETVGGNSAAGNVGGASLKGFPFVSQYSFMAGYAPTFADSACMASCYLAIANFFGKNTTMQKLLAIGDLEKSNARVNRYSLIGVGSYVGSTTVPSAVISAEIAASRPVILRLSPKADINDTHFVVAYGYTGKAASASEILVMDPARKMVNGTMFHGTLADAIQYQGKRGRVLSGYRKVSKK